MLPLGVALLAMPALAQTGSSTSDPTTSASPAPTAAVTSASAPVAAKAPAKQKVICEDQDETGSRLSRHRVCLTAQQWSEARAVERTTVERAQFNRPTNGH
jgi:hypothetical protein